MKKLILFLFLILFSLSLYGKNIQTITLCDFENFQPKGVWTGEKEITGTTNIEDKIVRSGKYSYKCSWDFGKATDGFLNFDFYIKTQGFIKDISFWLYAEEPMVGKHIGVWTRDVNGEYYFGGVTIEKTGWNHLTTPISVSPPWATGDQNSKQDPPMEFMVLSVDVKVCPTSGTIYIDDIEATIDLDITEDDRSEENQSPIDYSDMEVTEALIPAYDFEKESYIDYYTLNRENLGKGEIITNNVHSGKKAGKLSFMFIPDTPGIYIGYSMGVQSYGIIKGVELWAYGDKASLGASMSILTTDASEEIYRGNVIIDKEGWNKYFIPIDEKPAWPSGDKNGKPDGNMTFREIVINRASSPTEGYVIVDDISLLVLAPYANLIKTTLNVPGDDFWKLWAEKGNIEINIENFTDKDLKNLSCKINIFDTNTNKVVKEESIKSFSLKSHKSYKKSFFIDLPHSHYEVNLELYEGKKLIQIRTFPLTVFGSKCGVNLSPAMEAYLTRCGYWGGVTWQASSDLLRDAGCRWTRGFLRDLWVTIETEKDKYNTDSFVQSLKERKSKGIDNIVLMTTYDKPFWRKFDTLDFAPSYGKLFEAIAKTGLTDKYELGNEDNSGHTKTYAEVGRCGAAGARKYDAIGLIGNSATAGVDDYFFKVQKDKGLLDRLDLIIVHPYCNNNSPEDANIYGTGQRMIDLIDSVGGYKDLWTTEYGYNDGTEGPSVLSEKLRSQYYLRHTLIQTSTNYDRCGLFAWNQYWGIFVGNHGTLRALSIQTMAKQLSGYKFAGILSNGPKVWVLVYEKFGENPIAVCWTKEGEETFDLGTPKSYYDIYNNKLTKAPKFTEDPVYVHGIDNSFLIKAWEENIQRELDRSNKLAGLNLSKDSTTDELWEALISLGENINNVDISGASFHILKALLIKSQYSNLPKALESVDPSNFEKEIKEFLVNANKEDKDYPKARWALYHFTNIELERLAAVEAGKIEFAEKLLNCEKILSEWTKYLLSDKCIMQNLVWAYLYDLEGSTLKEKLTFIPDIPTRVKVRVNNYGHNNREAKVTLDLPEGWRCEPEVQTVELKDGEDVATYFDVIAKENTNPKDLKITTKTDIGIGVLGEAAFTDIELTSQISVAQMASHGLHPTAPYEFAIRNASDQEQKGVIKVYSKDKLVGEGTFENLAPKERKIYFVNLNEKPEDLNNMKVVVSGDDFKEATQNFKTEYCYAPKVNDFSIDKNESVLNKFPLFIDKEEYDCGSFLGSWTPNDLSATSYFGWDENYLYFRCLVTDNVFYQVSKGDDTFMFDSVQIDIQNKDKKLTQLCLAHLGENKDIVYMYLGDKKGPVEDFPCSIKNINGQENYSVSIPWKYILNETPKAGDEFKIEILLNDHDITAERRVLERFSDAIYRATHKTDNYGTLVLGE